MVLKLKQLEDEIQRRKGEIAALTRRRDEAQESALDFEHKAAVFAEARDTVAAVLAGTQEQVKGSIEEIVSLSLSTVYGNDYSFRLDVETKRNQTEMTPVVVINENDFTLRDNLGGGIVDVVSFSMRLALWSLRTPRSRATFLLDEPFKYVSKDKLPMVKGLLEEIVELLGAQIIMVSHESELIDCAERAWEVSLIDGTSVVEKVK